MKTEEKEVFRRAVLRVLDANRTRFGLNVAAVGIHVTMFSFSPSADEVADAIGYLELKGLCEEVLKTVNRGTRCWRITEKGIDWLDEGN